MSGQMKIGSYTPISYLLIVLVFATALMAHADQPSSSTVPSVDGGAGKCSADFTVTDPEGKPVYNAKVRVHVNYGFMGFHKLDLEVGTNADGKARFTGLPSKVKFPLEFMASYKDLQGSAVDDPAQTCKAQHQIILQKSQ